MCFVFAGLFIMKSVALHGKQREEFLWKTTFMVDLFALSEPSGETNTSVWYK